MAQIVVPFRGASGKQRLDAPDAMRTTLALAMLGDVLTACVATGRTFVVTADAAARALAEELGAEAVDDPGGGQGAAVAAGLERAENGAVLVVNADVPCVVPHDLRTLAGAGRAGCASGSSRRRTGRRTRSRFPGASLFASLYGAGSAEPLSRPRRRAGRDGRCGRDSEPARRRRHAGRPGADRPSCRPAHAGCARPAGRP